MLITTVHPAVDIKGGVTYDCNFMSQGAITARRRKAMDLTTVCPVAAPVKLAGAVY